VVFQVSPSLECTLVMNQTRSASSMISGLSRILHAPESLPNLCANLFAGSQGDTKLEKRPEHSLEAAAEGDRRSVILLDECH